MNLLAIIKETVTADKVVTVCCIKELIIEYTVR